MFNKKTNIDDVYSCLRVGEDYIVYYSSDFKLKLLGSKFMNLRFELQMSRDFEYKIHDSRLYFSLDNELKVLDIAKTELEDICHTDRQYIIALSNNRYLASSYQRKDKQYDNSIFDENCKLLWEESGDLSYRDVYETHLLLSDRRGNKIGYFDFEDCNIQWSVELSQSINGESIETSNLIIIPLSNSLIAFKRDTGEMIWKNEFSLSHYNYDGSSCKLYGIVGNTFEVIDVDTGELEKKKEFSENLHIASHLTYYDNDFLYFSGYRDSNIPVFGAVNVKSGKLEFLQEVKTEGEKSFRIGLEKPIVVGNRLYIKDSLNTLHIFEKTD
jgi:hypothetical protein